MKQKKSESVEDEKEPQLAERRAAIISEKRSPEPQDGFAMGTVGVFLGNFMAAAVWMSDWGQEIMVPDTDASLLCVLGVGEEGIKKKKTI